MKRQKNSINTDPFGSYSFKTAINVPEFETILQELVNQDPALNNCCLTSRPYLHCLTKCEKKKGQAGGETDDSKFNHTIGSKFYIDGLKQQGSIIISHQGKDLIETITIDDSSIHNFGDHLFLPLPDLTKQEEQKTEEEIEKEKAHLQVTIEFHRTDRALAKYIKQKLAHVLIAQRNPPRRNNDGRLKKLCYLFSLLNVAEKSRYHFTDSAIECARSIYFEDYVEIGMQIQRAHDQFAVLMSGSKPTGMSEEDIEKMFNPTNPIRVIYWRGRKIVLRRKIEIISEKTKQKIVLYYRFDALRRKFIFGLVETDNLFQ
jgi:hypothetical protein